MAETARDRLSDCSKELSVKCEACGQDMPDERGEYFPTCIPCTKQGKNKVIMTMCGKTGLHVGGIVKHEDTEGNRRVNLVNPCIIRRRGT